MAQANSFPAPGRHLEIKSTNTGNWSGSSAYASSRCAYNSFAICTRRFPAGENQIFYHLLRRTVSN